MVKTKAVGLVWIMSIVLFATVETPGKSPDAELKDRRISISVKNKVFYDVVKRLIDDYDIAIGFEQSNLDEGHDYFRFEYNIQFEPESYYTPDGRPILMGGNRPSVDEKLITVSYRNARLEEVMDDVVGQMKNYSWRVDNEVVNIFPSKGREPKFAKLMDTKVSRFHAPKDMEVGYLEALIVVHLPEFKTFVAENGLYTEAWQNASWNLDRRLPEEVSFSGLTFRELLNGITKAKRGGWIVKRARTMVYRSPTGEEKEFFELDI